MPVGQIKLHNSEIKTLTNAEDEFAGAECDHGKNKFSN